MTPFKQNLQNFMLSYGILQAQACKQSQEDDAHELILFDCLHMVFFKLHFARNSITISCPVIVFIIKKRDPLILIVSRIGWLSHSTFIPF